MTSCEPPGGLRIGWRYTQALGDAGAPPARPSAGPLPRFDPAWLAAQQRIARTLARPARLGALGCAVASALLSAVWLVGLAGQAVLGCSAAAAAAAAASCGHSAWRGRRRLRAIVAAERRRVAQAQSARSRLLATAQREHASDYRAWQRRKAISERQPSWFAVSLPAAIDRLDVAGGTPPGWAALLVTIAVQALSAGGEVTVVDLTESAVAADLIGVAQRSGLRPLVWVLPDDLPRLDLGIGIGAPALADVLALAAAASAEFGQAGQRPPGDRAGGDVAADCALLERVLGVLSPDPSVAQVTAALRVLAHFSDSPDDEVRAGLLTQRQVLAARALYGRQAAERLVMERAWTLEARLRQLDPLGTAAGPLPPSRLRVACLDRRSGVIGNAMLGTYVVAALTHMLRQASAEPDGRRWERALFLLGAERLSGDLLDRLTAACETTGTGLVLAYRSIPAWVRERLGRGHAAVSFMRLGNGEDARAASEQVGTEHRFVVGQITDTVGASVTDTWGGSYTSTIGTADSLAGSLSLSRSSGGSRGRGRSQPWLAGPFGDFSRSSSRDVNFSAAESESISLTEGINTGTSWGISLSSALGESISLGRTAQRSREFLVEPAELQRLPASAAIVSYPAARWSVVLVDVNPALAALADGQDEP